MAGFVGGERFTILVGMEAPRWVGEAVQQGLLALEDLTDAERCNNFATREAAAQAGGRVMLADDRLDPEWLSVAPVQEFSFG